jgi:DNA-binding NarL/FixJ family response regulator
VRPKAGNAGIEIRSPAPAAALPFGLRQAWALPTFMSHDETKIRVLTVDDHPLLREGIAGLIADETDMTLVAEATNGREAIEQFRLHRPDVTLMDLQMPELNGVDATTAIRAEFPGARVVVLTTYTGDVQVALALKAGASGYLLKNAIRTELLATIRAVHAGRKVLSPEITFAVANRSGADSLSPSETRVLRSIADGLSNKEIAAKLSLSEEAVKGQVKSILSKLDARDRTHAAVIGIRNGIIDR